MEILGFILLIIAYAFFGQILRAFFATLSAGWRTLVHGGNFRENFGTQFFGMSAFEFKGEKNAITKDVPFEVLELKGKGLMPVTKKTNISFVTSIIDVTDGEAMPVLAALDDFQEAGSRAFQHSINAGTANPDTGYIDWVRVGAVKRC